MATVTEPRGNGPPQSVADRLRFDPARRAERRPRTTWIALGLVLLLAFGLLGAITVARVADRAPVLALAKSIERGEELTPGHLTVVNVGIEEGVAVVAGAHRDKLLGRSAAAAFEAGTLIARSQFVDGPQVGPGQSVVGLALAPGEYPTAALRPGDHVIVVRSALPSSVADRTEDPPDVLAEDVEVFSVEPLSDTARTLMVSVTVPRAVAPVISSAAAAGRIRLVLVDQP